MSGRARPSIWERLAVPAQQLTASLSALFSTLPPDTPVLVHSDILRVGSPNGVSDATELCSLWLKVLQDSVRGRPLLIPTFNYDFCSTRRFDPASDLGQVGALSRHCVSCHSDLRTQTPIFNFCIFNNDGILQSPASNPFGKESVFAEIHRRNGAIVFLGVDMIANTFIHYLEEDMNIGYRYRKPFPGTVLLGNQEIKLDFHFRVRPRTPGAVAYDLLGETEMESAGLLTRSSVGLSSAMMIRANDYMNVIGQALRANELHVLTPEAQVITRQLYQVHGYPLTLEKMESSS